MELIPFEDRTKYRCHLCGTTKSVKYFVIGVDPIVSNKPQRFAYCNRCAAYFADKKFDCDMRGENNV